MGVAGCTAPGGSGGSDGDASTSSAGATSEAAGAVAAEQVPDATRASADHAALLGVLPTRSPGDLGGMRLAADLAPPSNRWFSGLVFGAEPQPVFPLPLSFGLTASGFALGAPVPVASPAAVVGPHVPALTVDLAGGAGALTAQVRAYDAATVTLALLDDAGRERASVVLAQGSPFVSVTAATDLNVGIDVAFGAVDGQPGAHTAEVEGRTWGMVTPGAVAEGGVALAAGEAMSLYLAPDDADDAARTALAEAAADPVTGSELTYGVGEHAARTTLTYLTASGGDTFVVAMPHHRRSRPDGAPSCGLGTYPSVHGTLELCAGPLVSQVPALAPAVVPDVADLAGAEREALLTQLEADVAAAPPYPSDTYFGGKALHRSATLVALGRALGADEVVAPEAERLEVALREWADPDGCLVRDARCFVHDERARSVIGLTPSFGSQDLNDHHFHYGYLLGAAGVLAADDPGLAADLAPVLDAVAQDVAAGVGSDLLPELRVFDAYAGHSWASGTAPFADGNNQESTSEAVAAWNGLALWARASGQAELETQARWLLSTEAATARVYWTEPDLDEPVLEGVEHRMFSIVWGAKRDHATWFSAEPSAILGIQLLPMVPVDGALAGDAYQVRAAVEAATAGGFDVQFGDYLAMYLAVVDPEAGRAAADEVSDAVLDGATSRSFLLAWLAAPPARAG